MVSLSWEEGGLTLDAIDRALLNAVQTKFPVEAQPYQSLGDLVGITGQEAIDRIRGLRQEGIIRRLGGVFDSHRLGYFSTLCSAKVPLDKIPVMNEILAAIPGVTHNYLRKNSYNIWFTLIAFSKEKVEEIFHDFLQKIEVKMFLGYRPWGFLIIRLVFDL